jgi:hypothetical protein
MTIKAIQKRATAPIAQEKEAAIAFHALTVLPDRLHIHPASTSNATLTSVSPTPGSIRSKVK